MTVARDRLKMFSFSVMQSTFCFPNVKILAKGRSDTHCKIKETLLIRELKPTLNDKVSSEKLYLY